MRHAAVDAAPLPPLIALLRFDAMPRRQLLMMPLCYCMMPLLLSRR